MTKSIIVDIVNDRRVILGPSDKIKSMTVLKYPWAAELFLTMENNDWRPSSVKSLPKDRDDYHKLNPGAQLGYKRALAFLTNLDGLQVENLTHNIIEHVTAFEIQQCIYRQIYEEANHVTSYDKIISTVFDDPAEIYLMHEKDVVLAEKNDFILAQAQSMKGSFNARKFVMAVLSNIILEGIYFHTGFLYFYVLDKLHGRMRGSSEMVKYIQRDEKTHCILFRFMFLALKQEFPEVFDAKLYSALDDLIDKGVNLEIAWGRHLIEQSVPGMTETTISNYVKFLADEQRAGIRLPPQYGVKNPYPWVEQFADPNGDKNFFETTVTAYSKKSVDVGSLF